MKIKEVLVGGHYMLAASKKSKVGGSGLYFELLKGEQVFVLNKLNNFNNKNTVHIQGICHNDNHFELVSFWCSPYDLKEIN